MENYSMLPQRARSGGLRALNDLSESETNARAMPPPSASIPALKRHGSNLPEPPQKTRKTLVERAGEPLGSTSSLSRPPSAASHYAPSTSSLYRSSSNASSTSLSRTNSISSRQTSNSSYAGSLASGIRPPTIGTVRPKSSYAKEKAFATSSRSLVGQQVPHEVQNKSKEPLSLVAHTRSRSRTTSRDETRSQSKWSSVFDLKRASPAKRIPSVVINMRNKCRDISLSTQLSQLRLDEAQKEMPPPETPTKSKSPSRIPRASPAPSYPMTPIRTPALTPKLRHKSTMKLNKFLTTSSTLENIDPDERYQDWKRMFDDSKQMFDDAVSKMSSAREETNAYKEQLTQVEHERSHQNESIILLKTENHTLKYKIESLEKSISELKEAHRKHVEELKAIQQQDIDTLKRDQKEELERLKDDQRDDLWAVQARHQRELEQERSQRLEAVSQVSTQGALEKQRHQIDLDQKDQAISAAKLEVGRLKADLERERQTNEDLRQSLKSAADNAFSMETARQGLQAKICYLESDGKAQSEAYAAMEKRMAEAITHSNEVDEKLRKEESARRKLHNQVQELKGNIRVFCRVRPNLGADDDLAKMKYPDEDSEKTSIEVRGPEEKNSLGKNVTKDNPFAFDRVFSPIQNNDDVFGEIELLIQSALDGYNVCIFAYGQTGSGKTYTMSSEDGMIPRSLRFIYDRCKDLEGRGWKYQIEGSFVEVYNEEIRDLLGDGTQKKYEVHHDHQNHETTVTNATTLPLDNKAQVDSILSQAMERRSVAATKANEHSSRSHSVFILKLYGKNEITGEESRGTLNLVDLAGSERIKTADTSGLRLKETQSINKSLSCLGDVIGALGQGTSDRSSLSGRDSISHIPYRNSKLTYLLQLSLGGNCKTLMFVMVAPEMKCLNETLTSLKFAEKVSKTRIGVAKKVKS